MHALHYGVHSFLRNHNKDIEDQLVSYLIQRGAGEDISSEEEEEGWLQQALCTWALTKKEELNPEVKHSYYCCNQKLNN